MAELGYDGLILDRMVRAVEKVKDRLLRAAAAFEEAGVAYAVAGGNAVAAWVATIDEAAVRNTRDVDVVLARSDLNEAIAAMETKGFVFRHVRGVDMFLDGPDAKARDAVHLIFAGEKVRQDYQWPAPETTESQQLDAFRVLSVDALVRMKLTSYRDKDRTHLRDMIDVGLIDPTWIARLPDELSQRLQDLFDNPDG